MKFGLESSQRLGRGASLGGRQVAPLVLAEDHEQGNGSVCREIRVANAVRAASSRARARGRETELPQSTRLLDDWGRVGRVNYSNSRSSALRASSPSRRCCQSRRNGGNWTNFRSLEELESTN